MHFYISSCKVRCFKSFGAEWRQINFLSPYLVGIVGPNGCGKSNLLEALQFAAGVPAAELRVKTLKELCSNTSGAAEQLCEVEFTISQQQQQQLTYSAKAHNNESTALIRAALTPDGSRAYQINGKNKTATEVKEFLRTRGVCLQSSVIRQATVTQLADTNSPQDIAAVLAGASGLARWDQETARAMSELRGAREALQEIKKNVAKLRQLIASDDSKLASLERAVHIHQAIQEVSRSLAHNYKQQQAAANVRTADMEAEVAALQDDLESLKEQLQGLEIEERAAMMAFSDARGTGSKTGESSLLAVLKEQVVLEEQVAQSEAKLHSAQQHAAEYAQTDAELQRLHLLSNAQAQGIHDLESRTEELRAQVAEAEDAQGSTDLQGLLASTQDMLVMSRDALQEAESVRQQKEARLEQLKADLQATETELKRCTGIFQMLYPLRPDGMSS